MARSAAIEAEKQQKKEDLKERQRINKIRREENAKKSEIVQVVRHLVFVQCGQFFVIHCIIMHRPQAVIQLIAII